MENVSIMFLRRAKRRVSTALPLALGDSQRGIRHPPGQTSERPTAQWRVSPQTRQGFFLMGDGELRKIGRAIWDCLLEAWGN